MVSPLVEAMLRAAAMRRGPMAPPSPQAEAMARAMRVAGPDAAAPAGPDASLDNLMSEEEAQRAADARAARTPVAKEGDPGVVSVVFDDQGQAKASPQRKARGKARR